MRYIMPRIPWHFKKIPWIPLLLGGCTALLFGWLTWGYSFVDPDAWYHARLASLFLKDGVRIDFFWLPFTQLAYFYTDHHWLYHAFVAPLTIWLPAWLSLKIMTVALVSAFAVGFYIFLREYNIPYPLLFVWLLFANEPFVFRMSLAKGLPLVLFILLVAIHACWRRHSWMLFVTGVAMVLAYAGWPLLIGIIISFASALYVKERFRNSNGHLRSLFLVVLSGCTGIVVGLVVHPYFPHNLRFYWEQAWQIAFLNLKDVIGVGGEWYGYEPYLLVAHLGLIVAFAVFIAAFAILKRKSFSIYTWWLFGWAVFFIIMTLKSQRYVEYLVPFSVLWLAFAFRDIGVTNWLRKMIGNLRSYCASLRYGAFIIIAYFVLSALFLTGRDVCIAKQQLMAGKPVDAFQSSAAFLEAHSDSGDIVVHSDWDEFPLLWYYDQSNRYIAGLDPSFFYLNDRKSYYSWVYLTKGMLLPDEAHTLVQKFYGRLVFIENGHDTMKESLLRSGRWKEVYQDEYASILELK